MGSTTMTANIWKHLTRIYVFHQLIELIEQSRVTDKTMPERGKPALKNTSQMLLISDSTGLHSNPARQ